MLSSASRGDRAASGCLGSAPGSRGFDTVDFFSLGQAAVTKDVPLHIFFFFFISTAVISLEEKSKERGGRWICDSALCFKRTDSEGEALFCFGGEKCVSSFSIFILTPAMSLVHRSGLLE